MTLRLFLALVALGSSVFLALRQPLDRAYAIGSALAAAILVLMQYGFLALRVEYAREILWAALAILGVVLWTRQQGKLGTTFATALIVCGALPVAFGLGLLR